MVGVEDDATPVEANQMLADGMSNAEIGIVQDVAHIYHIEDPLAFNRTLEAFVTDLDRERPVRPSSSAGRICG